MKIVGYFVLLSVALALLVAMCVILQEGHVDRTDAPDSDVVAGGKVVSHTPAPPSAPKPTPRAALPTV
ncbi:hypothetical protein C0Z18_22165 [Trinickia dabaoshanensis]|uniref:Sperm-specific protein Phi-1 n=1 Tax=Trinickia dabaoshanensis TaxID=564714 RepID=A0A2N7VI76_9BURK|nr:hypothetical protein [Trinickia dabaoshanensis]PMS16854.1 hypothetical protein C0Z18_22165 [Trinickia dabaoshanensis]